MKITKNVGTADRLLRTFVVTPAAIAGALVLGAGSAGGIVLWVVAGVMLATAASGYCPAFAVFGIDTCGKRGCNPGGKDAKDAKSQLRHAA
ncbi:MAG: DUF2892 domain-containing protein [Actinobacteria bacterium]|nr:DUF2892 domain-containing protein [Actinomycetota bacterium]